MLPKIRITRKKGSKVVWKLNFVRNSPRARMSIFPQTGAMGLERLACLKYYYVGKRQITFNLELNVAKGTHHTKKSFKYKLFGIEFRTNLISPRLEVGGLKD